MMPLQWSLYGQRPYQIEDERCNAKADTPCEYQESDRLEAARGAMYHIGGERQRRDDDDPNTGIVEQVHDGSRYM